MRILFTGGGTMGSVTPLIAVAEVLKDKDPSDDFYWIGTNSGPEKEIVKNYNMEFKSIYAGKLRRYFSWLNFLDVFKVIIGLGQSIFWLIKWQPQIIVSAGGFTAVPVVWAGWLLGVPSLIHQQDVRVGLANKLCAKCAKQITVCFPESRKYFSAKKTQIVGNPVRNIFKEQINKITGGGLYYKLGLNKKLPIVLVFGGGTGSTAINELVYGSLKKITKFCQLIHITGKLKFKNKNLKNIRNYYQFDFVLEMMELLKLVDLVVSRAGMGALTEIAYFKKPAIIIPMPNTHQEDNANYFVRFEAVKVLKQEKLDEKDFTQSIKDLLNNKKMMNKLAQKVNQVITWNAEEKMAELVTRIIKKDN